MQITEKLVESCDSRGASLPLIIVNHITAGAMRGVFSHFSKPENRASSHFGISRLGEIIQYVPIKMAAWTQGRIQSATAPIIMQLKGNPNRYAVSIEHEGWAANGLDGNLTQEQFQASVWLHKHIQKEVEKTYGNRILLNTHQVLGHYQIDSIGKPFCPGRNFPWGRLYAELARIDTMTMESYEEDLSYRQSTAALGVDAFNFLNRFKSLKANRQNPTYAAEANRKILLMAPVMEQMGLTTDPTAENILRRIAELETNTIQNGKFVAEGLRKLNVGIQHAKNVGLIT